MRVILTISAGPLAGRKTWLHSGQSIKVGRGELADFSFVSDERMSSVHFAVECDTDVCRVVDQQSRNGTFLNRERIDDAELHDGDVIRAGQTQLKVEIEDVTNSDGQSRSTLATYVAQSGEELPIPEALEETPAIKQTIEAPTSEPSSALIEPAATPASVDVAPGGATPVTKVTLSHDDGFGKRRTWLVPGQTVTVGRLELADYVVAADDQMSSTHFAIDCEPDECRIRDLQSRNGLFLNGIQVSEETVYDGDEIRAGRTVFVLSVDGGSSPPESRTYAAVAAATQLPARVPDEKPPTFTQEDCYSGATVFRGDQDPFGAEFARKLADLFPLYLLVDPLSLPPDSPELPDGQYLFDWLPEEAATDNSPLVVRASGQTWQLLLHQAWGCDAMVCLYSIQDETKLLAHLRRMVRYALPDAAPDEDLDQSGVLAFYRPGIMSALLAGGEREFVAELLTGLEAVFTESEDSWQLFGDSDLGVALKRLGFVQAEPAER